jgi:molybdate transport system permease protein
MTPPTPGCNPAVGGAKELRPFRPPRLSILAAYAVLSIYAGLILSTLWFLDLGPLQSVARSERTWFAVRLSLGAATAAACLALVCALPAAYALSRHRFAGRSWVDAVLELPMVVSPAALGAMLLMFFSQPIGQWVQEHAVRFVFTVAGVVLAQFVTVLGVAVRLVKTAFDEVPTELETVARTLGAGPRHVFWTVTLPLARRGVLAAFVVAWAKAVGEFGATIMLAGTMALRTETLPIAIYLRLSTADLGGTAALILMLLCLGLGALAVTRQLLGRATHA